FEKPYYNTTAQKISLNKQRHAKDQLCELNKLYNIAHDLGQWHNFLTQINKTKQEIEDEKKRQKLINHAAA
ncbi:10268_t:CDS:1, partial [Gigaspora margarita]